MCITAVHLWHFCPGDRALWRSSEGRFCNATRRRDRTARCAQVRLDFVQDFLLIPPIERYQVENAGPWSVSNVTVRIDWPMEVQSPYEHGKYALYLLDMPTYRTNKLGQQDVSFCKQHLLHKWLYYRKKSLAMWRDQVIASIHCRWRATPTSRNRKAHQSRTRHLSSRRSGSKRTRRVHHIGKRGAL